MNEYDYNKERPWLSVLWDMQLNINRSNEMRIKRLEKIVGDLADIVFDEEDIPSKLTGTLPSMNRFEL